MLLQLTFWFCLYLVSALKDFVFIHHLSTNGDKEIVKMWHPFASISFLFCFQHFLNNWLSTESDWQHFPFNLWFLKCHIWKDISLFLCWDLFVFNFANFCFYLIWRLKNKDFLFDHRWLLLKFSFCSCVAINKQSF